MNAEKLKAMQASIRIGGKGTVRRKKKVIHRTSTTDDKKLQNTMKKLGVNPIPGIEEVNMIKEDGSVIHFNNPKVQASLGANTFAITGHAETKKITDMVPNILTQFRGDNLKQASVLSTGTSDPAKDATDGDDDIPDLVENFDEATKIQN